MANLTLEKFDCEGEPSSTCARWERWKRSLNIYLTAAAVKSPAQKRANLLHWGGPELQEIFENIPGANVEPEAGTDVFKIAVEKLDEYFTPKQSKRYERHIFRLMKQEDNEKFDKFLIRLRQQAVKCQFSSNEVEDQLLDQICEKCSMDELRKKMLKLGNEMTLGKTIAEANSLEIVNRQLGEFNPKVPVNKIDSKVKERKKECYRCGSWNHLAWSEECPARKKTCVKCGLIGHFKLQCKKKEGFKRKSEEEKEKTDIKKFRPTTRKQVNSIDEEN